MPMRLVTLVRCVKSHRAEGKMDMILGGLKDFQCQKWVYSHAKDEETAYLEQLEKMKTIISFIHIPRRFTAFSPRTL